MTKTTDSTRGKSSISETVDKFSFGSGLTYLDNADLASSGLRFDILEIKFEPGRGFEGRDRWLVKIKVADGEPEQLSLGSNPGRDRPKTLKRTSLAVAKSRTCGCDNPARRTTSRRATANE